MVLGLEPGGGLVHPHHLPLLLITVLLVLLVRVPPIVGLTVSLGGRPVTEDDTAGVVKSAAVLSLRERHSRLISG